MDKVGYALLCLVLAVNGLDMETELERDDVIDRVNNARTTWKVSSQDITLKVSIAVMFY